MAVAELMGAHYGLTLDADQVMTVKEEIYSRTWLR